MYFPPAGGGGVQRPLKLAQYLPPLGIETHVLAPDDREWAERLGLGDRLALIPYAPRSESLRLQRDSEALLLLVPEAGGLGRGVLSGKVFEYLAAERPILAVVPPDGAAADLIRDTGAGVVAAPEDTDGIRDGLVELHARWRAGALDGRSLS